MTPIRTFLLLLVVSIAAFGAAAAELADRDILLTAEGTLFTVESESPEGMEITTSSSRILTLRVQSGAETHSLIVPATLEGGMHTNPALAYDDQSKTLFVFWQRAPMPRLTSEILFVSYQNGQWSAPTLVNKAGFEVRRNLRLTTNRFYFEREDDEAMTRTSGLVIHVVWWSETGHGEAAGYAQVRMDAGLVKSIQNADLTELLGEHRQTEKIEELPVDFNRELFRHPSLADNVSHDAVEITFADWDTNRFHSITIRPIADDGVLEPPTGIYGGSFGPPRVFHRSLDSNQRITVLPNADRSRIVFHYRTDTAVEYLSVETKASVWTDVKAITLNGKVSAEAAVEAIRRLVASQ